MKINRTLGIGIIGGLAAICTTSCKKNFKEAEVNPIVKQQLDTYNKQSESLLKDTAYHFFGKDTIKITPEFFTNPNKFIEKINRRAVKETPQKKIGTHTEVLMLPKSGGGFEQIPTIKSDYSPIYNYQIGVIKSDKLFTTNNKDLYVPIEYYGRCNN